MTITLDETTTTAAPVLSLREIREVAASTLSGTFAAPSHPIGSMVFNVPAGYTVVPDLPAGGIHHDRLLLVTAVTAPAQTAPHYNHVVANRVGLAIPGVEPAFGNADCWLAPGRRDVAASFVTGSFLRQGVDDVTAYNLPDGALICFPDGQVCQYWSTNSLHRRHDRNSGHTLNIIRNASGAAPAAPVMDSFQNRQWVQVEAVPAAAEPQAPAAPFTVPEGWTVVPTDKGDYDRTDRDLYITAVTMSEGSQWLHRVGTVGRGRLTNAEGKNWFIYPVNAEGSFFADAAVLTPRLEAGKHYLLEDGKVLFGSPDGLFRDVLTNAVRWPDSSWRRVLVTRIEDEGEVEAAAPEGPVRCEYSNERSLHSPLLGLAASSDPELDPAPVPGAYYVSWESDWVSGAVSQLLQYLGEVGGHPTFSRLGTYRVGDGELLHSSSRGGATVQVEDLRSRGAHWVRASLPEATYTPGPAGDITTSRLATLRDQRSTYSEALNELADEHDWCSEFEAVVTPLGFPGRDKEAVNDYRVTVEVCFTAVYDSPTHSLDTAIGNDLGQSVELSRMEMTGTTTLSIFLNEIKTPAGADNDEIRRILSGEIDDDRVAYDLADQIGGDIEVDSWSMDDWEVN